jgi:hypothetical protein
MQNTIVHVVTFGQDFETCLKAAIISNSYLRLQIGSLFVREKKKHQQGPNLLVYSLIQSTN